MTTLFDDTDQPASDAVVCWWKPPQKGSRWRRMGSGKSEPEATLAAERAGAKGGSWYCCGPEGSPYK